MLLIPPPFLLLGFGLKVSNCEGPPAIHRTITASAFASRGFIKERFGLLAETFFANPNFENINPEVRAKLIPRNALRDNSFSSLWSLQPQKNSFELTYSVVCFLIFFMLIFYFIEINFDVLFIIFFIEINFDVLLLTFIN